MKFNCGLRKSERIAQRVNRLEKWHDYFAWWPVRVGYQDCRWLEIVERKCIVGTIWGHILDTKYRPKRK